MGSGNHSQEKCGGGDQKYSLFPKQGAMPLGWMRYNQWVS